MLDADVQKIILDFYGAPKTRSNDLKVCASRQWNYYKGKGIGKPERLLNNYGSGFSNQAIVIEPRPRLKQISMQKLDQDFRETMEGLHGDGGVIRFLYKVNDNSNLFKILWFSNRKQGKAFNVEKWNTNWQCVRRHFFFEVTWKFTNSTNFDLNFLIFPVLQIEADANAQLKLPDNEMDSSLSRNSRQKHSSRNGGCISQIDRTCRRWRWRKLQSQPLISIEK